MIYFERKAFHEQGHAETYPGVLQSQERAPRIACPCIPDIFPIIPHHQPPSSESVNRGHHAGKRCVIVHHRYSRPLS
jgi:hypothetical protein